MRRMGLCCQRELYVCIVNNLGIVNFRSQKRSKSDNGHNDFSDENTIILKVEITDAVLLSHGTRYERYYGSKGCDVKK